MPAPKRLWVTEDKNEHWTRWDLWYGWASALSKDAHGTWRPRPCAVETGRIVLVEGCPSIPSASREFWEQARKRPQPVHVKVD